MFTDFRNRLTYFGTLDDVVYRYPWPRPLDLRAIQHQLLTAAIYDKKILVNDGYLVANPQMLGELTDISQSLLGNLLLIGTARLFARGGAANLAAGLERSAAQVTTHKELTDDKPRWRQMRNALDHAAPFMARFTLAWPADKNMGEVFYKLMRRTRELHDTQRASLIPETAFSHFDAIYDRFESVLDKNSYDRARTAWEDCCWIHFGQRPVDPNQIAACKTADARAQKFPGYAGVRGMMNAANEIYHLAYSVGAQHAIESNPQSQIDSTTMGMASGVMTAFPDLLDFEECPENLADRQTMDALNQLLVTIPPHLKFTRDFSFVQRLDMNQECREARGAYLQAVADFVDKGQSYDSAERARDDYIAELQDVLTPGIRRMPHEWLLARTFDFLTELVLEQTGSKVLEFLLPIGIDELRNTFVERLVRARIKGALRQEGAAAIQEAGSVPLARRLGLYMGPIKRDGANSIIASVKPHPSLARLPN